GCPHLRRHRGVQGLQERRRQDRHQRRNQGCLMTDRPLSRVRERQKSLESRKREALEGLRKEQDLIHAQAIQFLAHTMVLPSYDPEDQKQFDVKVEEIAMKVVMAREEAAGAVVRDV